MIGPILCVVGARPNYMKVAPIMRAFSNRTDLPRALLLHTGQHYDESMNDQLFRGLRLPKPDISLNVGSGSHAVQTAEVMKRFEPELDAVNPSCVLVVGDVNSTLACALVAVKRHIPVIHVEAGLRSHDRRMPEEINRLLTDQISDILYTTERSAHANLASEGICLDKVVFVGNVMIDTLLANLPCAVDVRQTLRRHGAQEDVASRDSGYAVVTLHRPANVDDAAVLEDLLVTLTKVSKALPLICPLHPRTRSNIERFGLIRYLENPRIVVLPPQGYLEMLGLMAKARGVLTDSGGVQEETTALGVPCLTLRDNTERPITAEQGTNSVVGRDRDKILAAVGEIIRSGGKRGRVPEYWDGKAAERIAGHLAAWLPASRMMAVA